MVKKSKKSESLVLTTRKVKEIAHKENMGLKLKMHEKLWFTKIKGVRKSGIAFAMTDGELTEYAKCKMSVHYFAQKYCQIKREDGTIGPMTLRDYQKDIIDLYTKNRFSILMASRQTGKTVSAAIVILHFVLFNNDKGVMIVANKGKTVKEIIRKIKDIYKLVPFHLKKGVVNWNETSIAFENGCRIQTENRTAEPSIGFTIDFLYLDEFAKVPKNIVEAYYGSIVPTVSSINNSKIVITSTPDGFNLFHKLLTDSEREIDDPLRNMYEGMRVYWHQVKGRMDVKLLPLAYKLKLHNISNEFMLESLSDMGYELRKVEENNRVYHYITYDIDDDRTSIEQIRRIRLGNKNIPLQELCVISNWKEEETKLIGGEEMFNQEYDLQFVTGDKLLFDSEQMNKFKKDSIEFKYMSFSKLDSKLSLPYSQLKWVDKPEIFSPVKMKDYHIVASVDLGEGLCQDYSVLNIFRLMPKPKELIEKTHENLSNVFEYFYLEQIGMYRVNNWSITEFAELFYLVMFELFDPEKSKVVLEYNTYGAEFLSQLTKIFEGEHDYSTGIFLRYKHRKDDKILKIGMKITGGENEASKKILVKSLQGSIKKQLIKIHNDININEISVFTKKETPSGNFTYQCESGNDDTVMSLVSLSSVFTHVQFKNLIENLLNEITPSEKKIIDQYAYNKVDDRKVNYEATKKSYKKIYKNGNIGFGNKGSRFADKGGFGNKGGFKSWKSSPWD